MIGFALSLAEVAELVSAYAEPAAKFGSAAATVVTLSLSAMQYWIAKQQLAQAQTLARIPPVELRAALAGSSQSEPLQQKVIRPTPAEISTYGRYYVDRPLGAHGSEDRVGFESLVRSIAYPSGLYRDSLSTGWTGAQIGGSGTLYVVLIIASFVAYSSPSAADHPVVLFALVALSVLCTILRRGALLVLASLVAVFLTVGRPTALAVQLGLAVIALMMTWMVARGVSSWLWRFGVAAVGLAAIAWIL